MAITPVSTNPVATKRNNNFYENPVNRKTERNLAILGSAGWGALAGVTAGGLTSCVTTNKKISTGVGFLAALATILLTLPSKLYTTKLSAFTREKEMDVFSRQKDAQANIYADINKEIKKTEVPLAEKINHYATVKMADNGNGLLVKGA